MSTNALIQKVWNFCNTLRDDGLGYGDYLEQLTYLLFLKMAYEYTEEPYNRDTHIPVEFDWNSLIGKFGKDLEMHYLEVLNNLGLEPGLLGSIFAKAENKIQNPAKLKYLIDMINVDQWINLATDTKGDLYEGLLEKNAEDTKSGAGQYFTTRPLIQAMINCVQPEPKKTIADPACGTGGFFLGAYNWFMNSNHRLDDDELRYLKFNTFYGNEIVTNTHRMCLMNLFLHGIGDFDQDPNIKCSDALINPPKIKYDYVFANPPFGKKSSLTFTNKIQKSLKSDLSYLREDFFVTTSNKQLNFLQHIMSILKDKGKAAVVVPDNVLFEGGVSAKLREKLFNEYNVHTLLRLPTGIFYAQGVKANVMFFELNTEIEKPRTKNLWIYDLRTNKRFTLKNKQMRYEDLEDFVKLYNTVDMSKRFETERFKKYSFEELGKRDLLNIDITWLKDKLITNDFDDVNLDSLSKEIIEHLETAILLFKDVSSVISE